MPAGALGYRGAARATLGEREGVEEMRRALALALEHGEGRAAATLYNNLAFVAWSYDGPQAGLDVFREGIEFACRRGITETADIMAGGEPPLRAGIGEVEQALTDAAAVADRLEQAGHVDFVQPRSLQLRLLAERGDDRQTSNLEPLLSAARDSGEPQWIAMAVAAAAPLLLAQGKRERARALLAKLNAIAGTRADEVYAGHLPGLVRTALALGDTALATSLAEGVEPLTPLHQHALAACQAQLVEAAGDHAEAARLHADAAERWRGFGNVPERAYALLGQGRCLRALGDSSAERPLDEARELFRSIGYKPALAETEALVAQSQQSAS